jgi:hypothetical protein
MRIKSAITAFTILISTAFSAPLEAQNNSQSGGANSANNISQNNGFRIGATGIQAPTASPLSPTPVQGMSNPIQGISNPIQGMTNPPILPLGGGIPQQQQQNPPNSSRIQGAATILSPGATIFVPPGTLVIENNDAFIPGAILSAPELRPSNVGSRGSNSQNFQGQRGRPANSPPGNAKADSPTATAVGVELGTSRDKVIEKFGNPVAFMMGMNGETLYFNNGVVVFVKDGVVATPGN